MGKKSGMGESRFADIEQTQEALRASIEKSKALTAQSEQLIARNREQAEKPPAPTMPAPTATA